MPTSKPNILFIVLDTQRRDRLPMYGYAQDTAPHLEDFSAKATIFDRAIAPAQWTIPSHTSMFTGLYPSAHQVTQGYSQLSAMHPTFTEVLQVEGYHTVGFCNNPLVGVLNHGLQRGFDQFYNYAGATTSRPFQRLGAIRRSIRQAWWRFAQPVQNYFAHSDHLFQISMNPLLVPLWTRLINYKGNTARSIDDTIAYIQNHRAGGADRPLYTFLNLMGTHLPYRPPQDYLDRVAPKLDRHAYQFMNRFNSEASRWASPTDPPLTDWEQRTLHDFYDAEILHQDYHLGRLFKMLQTSGALEDTVLIIAADHGESHGDHDFFGHSFVVYQELVHVPLMIYAPEGLFPAGKRVQTNVSTRRIFHTVLDLAGVDAPLDHKDPNAAVEALSLRQAVNGAPDTEGGIVFSEAYPPSTFLSVIENSNPAMIERLRLRQVRRGVYDGAHKLAVVQHQPEALFNVAQDPSEAHNLAADDPARVACLQQHLDTFVKTTAGQDAEQGQNAEIDAAVVENLRALGYID
jgi:arylsulfatase A-like enzyme